MAENVDLIRRANAFMSASPEEVRLGAAEFWDADADYYPARKFPEVHRERALADLGLAPEPESPRS
jgi:hypothetical protein